MIQHRRFGYLLAGQLIVLLGYPLVAGDHPRPVVLTALITVVILASLHVLRQDRRAVLVGGMLGLPAILVSLWSSLSPQPWLERLALLSITAAMAFVSGAILKGVLTSARVTLDALYGAISSYLFAGLSWGMAYTLVESVWPGSFHPSIDPGRSLLWTDFSFFSFTTLSTLGYGDLVPMRGVARSLSLLEGVVGVMFPAVIIGRLIGSFKTGSGPPEEDRSPGATPRPW